MLVYVFYFYLIGRDKWVEIFNIFPEVDVLAVVVLNGLQTV